MGTEPGTHCNKTSGQCVCKMNVMGLKCDQCKDGYHSLGSSQTDGCSFCNCNAAGTLEGLSNVLFVPYFVTFVMEYCVFFVPYFIAE